MEGTMQHLILHPVAVYEVCIPQMHDEYAAHDCMTRVENRVSACAPPD